MWQSTEKEMRAREGDRPVDSYTQAWHKGLRDMVQNGPPR